MNADEIRNATNASIRRHFGKNVRLRSADTVNFYVPSLSDLLSVYGERCGDAARIEFAFGRSTLSIGDVINLVAPRRSSPFYGKPFPTES